MDIDEADLWLREINLVRTSNRARDLLIAAAEQISKGETSVDKICATVDVNPTSVNEVFGSRRELLESASAYVIRAELEQSVKLLSELSDGITRPRVVGRVTASWFIDVTAKLPDSQRWSIRHALAQLVGTHSGRERLGIAMRTPCQSLTYLLRDWQAKWLARDEFDPVSRAYLLIGLMLADAVNPTPRSEGDTYARNLSTAVASLADIGDSRALAIDSWTPHRRLSQLPDRMSALDRSIDELVPQTGAWLHGVCVRSREVAISSAVHPMPISKLCDGLSVSSRTVYEHFESAEHFEWKLQSVHAFSDWVAIEPQLMLLDACDSSVQVESLLSDIMQSFADPGETARRALCLKVVSQCHRYDVSNDLQSALVRLFQRCSLIFRGLQGRGLSSGGVDPKAIPNLLFMFDTAKAICDCSIEPIPDAAWGWELDLVVGSLFATSDSSVFRTRRDGIDTIKQPRLHKD